MPVNYDLSITVGGYLSTSLESIVAAVAPVVGAYPGYTYQRTEITGDVIHIFYSDDNAIGQAQAEVIPLIVYAILAVIGILGIAYISYNLKTVAQTSPTLLYAGVAIVGLLAVSYLINAIKK